MARLPLKAVIFDLDGTLVDSAPDIALALDHALGFYQGPSIPLADVRVMIGDGVKALISKAFAFHKFEASDMQHATALADFLDYASNAPAVKTRLFDGTLSLLNDLRAANIKIGVCTNKVNSLAHLVIESVGIAPLIDLTIGGDGPYPPKPDPSSLIATIEGLGALRSEAIYVGDMRVDALAARNAEVAFLAVDHGYWPFHNNELKDVVCVKAMQGLRHALMLDRNA